MTSRRKPKELKASKETAEFAMLCMRAMKRARKTARKLPKMHGTPIAYMRKGKIVEEYHLEVL